jgi:hypothetical protein
MQRCYRVDLMGDLNDDKLCFLSNNVEDLGLGDVALFLGERLGSQFPPRARIYMDANHPGKKLSALIGNSNGLFIASRELKDVIEKHCGDTVEYLPVSIFDHRKRLASKDYFVINPLVKVDCLDLQKSTYDRDDDDPDMFFDVEPVIDRTKVEGAPQLFRILQSTSDILLGYDLVGEIDDRDFSNFFWERLPFSDE